MACQGFGFFRKARKLATVSLHLGGEKVLNP
jgi:hypothetical protein